MGQNKVEQIIGGTLVKDHLLAESDVSDLNLPSEDIESIVRYEFDESMLLESDKEKVSPFYSLRRDVETVIAGKGLQEDEEKDALLAISEIANNTVVHAAKGVVELFILQDRLIVKAEDLEDKCTKSLAADKQPKLASSKEDIDRLFLEAGAIGESDVVLNSLSMIAQKISKHGRGLNIVNTLCRSHPGNFFFRHRKENPQKAIFVLRYSKNPDTDFEAALR